MKITCDEDEKRLFGKMLMWPNCGNNEKARRNEKRERKKGDRGGCDHDLSIW